MSDQFPEFIERLLGHEGGYSNDPKDPGNWTGGKVGVGVLKGTKFGIAANTYPDLDIRNLTRDQAINIYRRDFWDAAGLGNLHPAIGYQMLDGAINSGLSRGTKFLQDAARVTVDGKIGPITRAAVQAADHNDIVMRFNAYRLRFMKDLPQWSTYSRGWADRIAANLLYAADDN